MRRRLRWLGHLVRMDSTRLPKQLLVCRPLCGKRSVGGQRRRWNDLVMCDLKNCDLLADWRDIAKERSTWRALVGEAITDLNGKREKDVRKKDELKRRRESPVTLGHSTASSTTPSAIAYTVQGCSFVGQTKAWLVNHTTQKHGVTAQVHNPCPHCGPLLRKQGMHNHMRFCSKNPTHHVRTHYTT